MRYDAEFQVGQGSLFIKHRIKRSGSVHPRPKTDFFDTKPHFLMSWTFTWLRNLCTGHDVPGLVLVTSFSCGLEFGLWTGFIIVHE